jgi:MFS family permease
MLTYREGPERMKALGYYSLISSGGGSVGLVLGGMLTDWASWRWGLFINVPIGIALIVTARQVLTETEPETGRFDVAGAVTSTLGITALVYGFIRVAEAGWTATEVLVSFAVGVVLLVSFVLIERRVSHPIVPLRLFRSPVRSASYLTMLLIVGTMFGMFFFLTQYLQGVLGLKPFAAGLAFLPLTGLLFAQSRVIPRLLTRIDGAKLMLAGSTLVTLGTIWLTQLDARSTYLADVVGPLVLFGAGAGMIFIPLVGRAISGVPPEDSGAASGMLNVVQQVGGALGLGILVTIFGTASRNSTSTVPREVLVDGVHAAFVGSLVYAAVSLVMIVVSVRPWNWFRNEPQPIEPPAQVVTVD